MKTSVAGMLVSWGVGLLLLGGVVGPASAAPIDVNSCGTLAGGNSYILQKDLQATGPSCLLVTANGASINLNGHSISGFPGANAGIAAVTPGNNVTITGPGIVHDFIRCIDLGNYALVESVLVYNCEFSGIRAGFASKCVQCRVHDVRSSEVDGIGIELGLGCLLESSIVERSDIGAQVGQDCKVWDLVVDTVLKHGLRVDSGTSVARTVISHYHDGPGLIYNCPNGGQGGAFGCQDSSNSVTQATSLGAAGIAVTGVGATVITDCATNVYGNRFQGVPPTQCPN